MRRPQIFRQVDVTRAIKATLAAGLKVVGVEIEPSGKIVIRSGEPVAAEPVKEFDTWRKKRNARAA